MTTFYFVEPSDSLFVRGNLAFGGGGEHGAGVMPPPPSLFAGAFRSAILGRNTEALEQFTRNGRCDDLQLFAALGSADQPGAFRVAWLTLAGEIVDQTTGAPEPVFPLPADLVLLEKSFACLTPSHPNSLVADNRELPRVAVLRTGKQAKPQHGVYLREAGWRKHVAGLLPDKEADSVRASHLYSRDPRLGIGLNADARTAEPGLIYTTEGYAFSPKFDPARSQQEVSPFTATGFLIGLDGVDGLLLESGFLRLGGDGRGAHYRRVDYTPPDAPDTVVRNGRFRLILTTPGLFSFQIPQAEGRTDARSRGWLPARITLEASDYVLRAEAFSACLVCAAVPRREIVSGWDLFKWRPKDAERAVPAGSVYWFEDFHGDYRKLTEWVASGLWGDDMDGQRRAEGFNNATIAAWPQDE